jgi:hypothetical protein
VEVAMSDEQPASDWVVTTLVTALVVAIVSGVILVYL